MFWFPRDSFDRVNGFHEGMVSLEDLDFARRLKAYGAMQGRDYGAISRRNGVIVSTRKFDTFGD